MRKISIILFMILLIFSIKFIYSKELKSYLLEKIKIDNSLIEYRSSDRQKENEGIIYHESNIKSIVDLIATDFPVFDKSVVPYIILDPTNEIVTASTWSYPIIVNSNIEWNVREDYDWLDCPPFSGSNEGFFTIAYTENTSASSRSCDILVRGDGESEIHTITKEEVDDYFIQNPDSMRVTSEAGSYEISIISNTHWEINPLWDNSSSTSWVTIDPESGFGDGSITITYEGNALISPRYSVLNGYYSTSNGYETWAHSIYQEPANLCVAEYNYGCLRNDGFTDFAIEEIQNLDNGCANNTGFTGWSQYLSLGPAILEQGGTYQFQLATGYNNNFVDIWIDFNDDLVFTIDELVLNDYELVNAGVTYTPSIMIPVDAISGEHLMRARTNSQNLVLDPCEEYEYGEAEDYKVIIHSPDGIELNLKVYLEGPFNGFDMTPFQDYSEFSMEQPFNVSPWNYPGAEILSTIPNNNIVDWVLLEYRDATDITTATVSTMIHRQAALLLNNRRIVGLDGHSNIQFDQTISQNLYLVVWHRNHLGIISPQPLIEFGGIYEYDFTSDLDKGYGGTNAQKELVPGVWGMIGADADANGSVNDLDKNIWSVVTGESGYLNGDFNLNGEIDNSDKNDIWASSRWHSSQIPNDGSFTCGNPLIDSRDGKSYNTVQIGNQCWMADNLNYEITSWAGLCYDEKPTNCDIYGSLYWWDESPNFCPEGWHLPELSEWDVLINNLGGSSIAGGKMKTTGTLEDGTGLWLGPNNNATNSSGFSALPGGYYYEYSTSGSHYFNLNSSTTFLTATEYINPYSYAIWLSYSTATATSGYMEEGLLGSIRCVRDGDPENQAPLMPNIQSPSNGQSNIPLTTNISWTCSDPENDPLTYDIFFDTSNPPNIQVSAGQAGSSYALEGLNPYTTYYWQIVAHDEFNTTEGFVWSFTTSSSSWICGDPIIDDRDLQSYNTVQIGNQCWMAENMNYELSGWEGFCYDEIPTNCDTYGSLYSWDAALNICPEGWHLPVRGEWQVLFNVLGGSSIAGGKMKTTGTLEGGTGLWLDPNLGGTNSSGFSAFPGGFYYPYSTTGTLYFYLNSNATFWTATEYYIPEVYSINISYSSAGVFHSSHEDTDGVSVRCIKNGDLSNLPPITPRWPSPSNGQSNLPINTNVSWICSDPENDLLTYDVFFDTTNPPNIQVSTGQLGSSYDPGVLDHNTTYYWQIVAHDESNTTEGFVWTFTTESSDWVCGDPIIDDRDIQSYNTVLIGDQCWMAENLNYGSLLNQGLDQTDNGTVEKYCIDDLESNCTIYGGNYQWSEIMNYISDEGSQGICPNGGWHIPTDSEWCILENEVDSDIVDCNETGYRGIDGGGHLKQEGTTLWSYPNEGATNSSGFLGLPGGYYNISAGQIDGVGLYGQFFSSTITTNDNPWIRGLQYGLSTIRRTNQSGEYGINLRCIKD